MANAESVNNLMRQWNTSYQHAQYWQKNNTQRYMTECVLSYTWKSIGVKLDNEHWYGHAPKPIETSNEGKLIILWNKQVRTDITISNNKPDIIIHDNKKGTCMLIDVAIRGNRNEMKKEGEKT